MKYWPAQATSVIKGNFTSGDYYYTNSIHIAADADVDYIERIEKQSRFHPLIEAGAIVHVWLGEHEPDPGAIMSFVKKAFRQTLRAGKIYWDQRWAHPH